MEDGLDEREEAAGDAAGPDAAAAPAVDLGFILRHLRGLALPCFPPVGVGSFDVLYASEREIVVWYSPAREEHREGEVCIPCVRLAAAWSVLIAGEPLDEAALARCGEGIAGGRWLLALLAQLPGVQIQPNPLAILWSPPAPELVPAAIPSAESARKKPRRASPGAAKRRRARTQAEPPATRLTARSQGA